MDLGEYFEDHSGNPAISQWLRLERILGNIGRQGIVGVMEPTSGEGSEKFCFKFSKFLDYTSENEMLVCEALQSRLVPYCHHFVPYYGSLVTPVYNNKMNPFEPPEEKSRPALGIEKRILFFKYLQNCRSLETHIRKKSENQYVFNLLKQTLLALQIAQQKIQFTHYDLHPGNILVQRCDPDLVFLYVLDEQTQVAVATQGYLPVIIDYGNSYCSHHPAHPLWSNMWQTKMGMTTWRSDPMLDAQVLLLNSSSSIQMSFPRKHRKARQLRQLAKNVFPEKDPDTGWEEGCSYSALDRLHALLDDPQYDRTAYGRKTNFFLEILQPLATNADPTRDRLGLLAQGGYSEIQSVFASFMQEWLKLEAQTREDYFNMALLRELVLVALQLGPGYRSALERAQALRLWNGALRRACTKIVPHVDVGGVNQERLLCSMLLLGKSIRGIFYDTVFPEDVRRVRKKARAPIQNLLDLYQAVEINAACEYVYHAQTFICVVDAEQEINWGFTLSAEEIAKANQLHPVCRGGYLWQLAQTSRLRDISLASK